MTQLDRITQQPDVMGGKACIRGMRVTVAMIVNQNPRPRGAGYKSARFAAQLRLYSALRTL